LLRLVDGIRFSDLSISRGSGPYASDTIIRVAQSGEVLAILSGIDVTLVGQSWFE